MTDLPYGRGGAPLQNLIIRGHKNTKITAFRVEKVLDAGPIYLKYDLNLSETARDIFKRASIVMFEMISHLVNNNPTKQIGEAVEFKRRTPEMSDISDLTELSKIYDYIRMVDEKTKTIITFETPSGTEWRASSDPRHFIPNLFFEVNEQNLESKIQGMESYEF